MPLFDHNTIHLVCMCRYLHTFVAEYVQVVRPFISYTLECKHNCMLQQLLVVQKIKSIINCNRFDSIEYTRTVYLHKTVAQQRPGGHIKLYARHVG